MKFYKTEEVVACLFEKSIPAEFGFEIIGYGKTLEDIKKHGVVIHNKGLKFSLDVEYTDFIEAVRRGKEISLEEAIDYGFDPSVLTPTEIVKCRK